MPDNNFSNSNLINITPSTLSSVTSGASLNSLASISEAMQAAVANRYTTTRDLLSQMTAAQGRLPAEVDQKLQGLLQNIGQELQSLNTSMSDPATLRQENQSVTTTSPSSVIPQFSLRQLATLLSQQPLPNIPSAIRTSAVQNNTQDITRELQNNLVRLVQQQPATWQPDTALGKSVLNWLIQSQLSLKNDYWQSLPVQDKNQLIQTGIQTPTSYATSQQSQLIQKITAQIFDLLTSQKNLTPSPAATPTPTPMPMPMPMPIQSQTGQPIAIANITERSPTEIPSSPPIAQGINIDLQIKSFLQTITTQSKQLPPQIKALVQQLSESLQPKQQFSEAAITSENTSSNTLTASPAQLLLNNQLLKEINTEPDTQPATTARLISRIQAAISQNNLIPDPENVQTPHVENSQNTRPVTEQKTEILVNRWALQLIMPKLMLSTEAQTQKIEIREKAHIWLPDSSDEWQQHQPALDVLKSVTQSFLQQLNVSATQTPQLSTIQNADSTKNIANTEGSITAIQGINHGTPSAIQQLLANLQNLLSTKEQLITNETSLPLPLPLRLAAAELTRQFTAPLQTTQDVNSWIQFLFQPMDNDGAYSKSLQQWLFQLLTQRAKTSQLVQNKGQDEHDLPIQKEQLSRLDKLSEQTIDLFRLPPQPTTNTPVPSQLQLPLPPRPDGEEQGQLALQRNTKDDRERGWNISLYLEPARLGPIRFQARIALPEISLSIVAEKFSTIDLIKQTYPLLEKRFQDLGLLPQTLQIRQGKPRKEAATELYPQPPSGLSIKV